MKDAPDAPTPIDPRISAQAQTDSNIATARLQQQLGMTGSFGPGGSVTYRADPNAPSGYSQYTDLAPEQQQIYNLGAQAQQGALRTANDQIGRINTALGQQLAAPTLGMGFDTGAPIKTDFATGPGLRFDFDQGGQVAQSFDSGGALNRSFNPGQQVQGSVGPTDFNASRDAATNAVFDQARSRLDPMWNQAEDRERVRLANQGLSENSSAYQTAKGTFDRSRNDAYNDAAFRAVQAGGAEDSRLFGQQVAQGQFANQAAGQEYGQNLGLAGFANDAALADYGRNQGMASFNNQAVGQQYGQNMGSADFGNTASNLQFGQNQSAAGFNNTASGQQYAQNQGLAGFLNSALQQNFQNQAYAQNQPINQFATLMGQGGSVAMPSAYSGPTAGVSPTDVLGSYGLFEQGRQANYAQQVASVNARNQALGNLFGSGLGAAMGNWGEIFGGAKAAKGG